MGVIAMRGTEALADRMEKKFSDRRMRQKEKGNIWRQTEWKSLAKCGLLK